MNSLGYMRVASALSEVRPGDVKYNINQISDILRKIEKEKVELVVFPELCVTGYTCADLFFQSNLLKSALEGLEKLTLLSEELSSAFIVGMPLAAKNNIYNCAAIIKKGEILGVVPKRYLPNYNEFYEQRWFAPGKKDFLSTVFISGKEIPFSSNLIFDIDGANIGIEICEDLWVPIPPSSEMTIEGADIIANLSATDELAGKHAYLRELISQQSARCRCGYIYSSAGIGESSTDLAFAGNTIIAENGRIIADSKRFCLDSRFVIADIDVELLRNDRMRHHTFRNKEWNIEASGHINVPMYSDSKPDAVSSVADISTLLKYREIDPSPFVAKNENDLRERCSEISSIQAWGLMQRLRAINCKKAVVGISGGLDSTLALLVTVKAFDMLGVDRKGIIGITMPGFGTTDRTHNNAWNLMVQLGVTPMEIPINAAVMLHFKDIDQDPECHDATYENSQARERTMILMDMANKVGGIVIGTGDLSELALGWCTYNGDQMSMYGVNASVPKTLVRDLVKGYMIEDGNPEVKKILADIIATPISPELLPASKDGSIAQITEDFVGPYELHDFFLHSMLRHSFSPRKIYFMALKAFDGKYSAPVILKWLRTFYRRFFSQQFKRSCMPDGVKVGSVCLSPRGDWRMPSDASVNLWLDEIDSIKPE